MKFELPFKKYLIARFTFLHFIWHITFASFFMPWMILFWYQIMTVAQIFLVFPFFRFSGSWNWFVNSFNFSFLWFSISVWFTNSLYRFFTIRLNLFFLVFSFFRFSKIWNWFVISFNLFFLWFSISVWFTNSLYRLFTICLNLYRLQGCRNRYNLIDRLNVNVASG